MGKYPKIPDIPGNTRNTRKYPKVKKIPGNTRSYFLTLLPDPNPTRYPVFCPIPDPTRPDIEKPYPLATACDWQLSQFSRCFIILCTSINCFLFWNKCLYNNFINTLSGNF